MTTVQMRQRDALQRQLAAAIAIGDHVAEVWLRARLAALVIPLVWLLAA
jgi:hypothetical protein